VFYTEGEQADNLIWFRKSALVRTVLKVYILPFFFSRNSIKY